MQTTRCTRFAVLIGACLCGPARAESLFQRLPEPGRWCRYRTVLLATSEGQSVARPEQRGQVTISALDIADVDGVPHQWIEISNAIEVPTGDAEEPAVTEVITYKCLVRRDELQAGGDPLGHIARGWLKRPDSAPTASDVESFSAEGPEALVLRFVMSGPLVDVKPVTVSRSATIDEKEIESSAGITGTLDATEIGDLEIGGEFTYWTHESAGFGVLASEFLLNARRSLDPNTILKMQIAVQLDIEDQGGGAVSKLPDSD